MIGTESWLNDEIFSSKILPNVCVFRRDREDSYASVFIAVKSEM